MGYYLNAYAQYVPKEVYNRMADMVLPFPIDLALLYITDFENVCVLDTLDTPQYVIQTLFLDRTGYPVDAITKFTESGEITTVPNDPREVYITLWAVTDKRGVIRQVTLTTRWTNQAISLLNFVRDYPDLTDKSLEFSMVRAAIQSTFREVFRSLVISTFHNLGVEESCALLSTIVGGEWQSMSELEFNAAIHAGALTMADSIPDKKIEPENKIVTLLVDKGTCLLCKGSPLVMGLFED